MSVRITPVVNVSRTSAVLVIKPALVVSFTKTLNWIVSGDLIFIVVLGGTGRLFGPVFGAVAFFLLQELLRDVDRHLIPIFDASWLMEFLEAQWASIAWQDNLESALAYLSGHWKVMFGPILILVVLFARGGVDGLLEALDRRLRARLNRGRAAS